jgi:hypothetical protein
VLVTEMLVILVQAVKECGTKWKKVCILVRTRTAQQCRERYMNVLSPDLTDQVSQVGNIEYFLCFFTIVWSLCIPINAHKLSLFFSSSYGGGCSSWILLATSNRAIWHKAAQTYLWGSKFNEIRTERQPLPCFLILSLPPGRRSAPLMPCAKNTWKPMAASYGDW